MTEEIVHHSQKKIDKQMGCMAGFLHIFDRNQFLAGKRVYATKRLPSPSPAINSSSQSEKSEESPALSRELNQKLELPGKLPECVKPLAKASTSPDCSVKESLKPTWKFRETPRLSLDSRAIIDNKGSLHPREIRTTAAILSATRCKNNAEEEDDDRQRRSPSVVARLMGLEALPDSLKKPELTRSASESRSKDLLHCGFVNGNNSFYYQKQSNAMPEPVAESKRSDFKTPKATKATEITIKKLKSDQSSNSYPWKYQQQRKNFYDSQDFFPEPVKQSTCLYGELEKRLKMRGISEPAEDLETLKQILEALQLKGLLHSRRQRSEEVNNRNFILDHKISYSPRRIGSQSPPSSFRHNTGIRGNNHVTNERLPPVRGRLERSVRDNSERRYSNSMSPDRSQSTARSPRSPTMKKLEMQKRRNDTVEQKRNSPVHSPRLTSTKNGSDQVTKSRNINKRSKVENCSKERISSSSTEDESSSISESGFSTGSQKSRRMKTEDCNEGKNLLARCDTLLNSIANITTTDSQPSPVSVLDSFLNEDDELSPLKQRCIDFKDQVVEMEKNNSTSMISSNKLKSDDIDFVYVSEIFEASSCISKESDLFSSLENQIYKSNSSSVSKQHRRLVFHTITEIIERKKQLPPWKAVCNTNPITERPLFSQVWLEFSKIRERSKGGDLLQVVDGALEKDLAEDRIHGWGDWTMETSEMVLDIERLIFKDLVGETIRDFAATFSGKSRGLLPKKLSF